METTERYSKKREAILNCIRSTKCHPDAEWVYNRLKGEYPDLSLGTVYRNIARFKETGEVVAVANVDGAERIDGDVSPHGHMICRKCGAVLDYYGGAEIDDSLLNGFTAERCSVVVYGVCSKCEKVQSAL